MKRDQFLGCVLACVLALTLGAASVGAEPPKAPPITVVFRYDDYAGDTADNVETRIMSIFEERGLQLTVAVIPKVWYIPLSPEKAERLVRAIDAGAVDMAQHGFTHDLVNKIVGRGYNYGSEFGGIVEGEQRHRILEGKAFLEQRTGKSVTTFVPPYNGYDLTTVRVLERCGFQCLSASTGSDVTDNTSLKFVPATCELRDFEKALRHAQKYASEGPILLAVLTHTYDYKERSPEKARFKLDDLARLVDWARAQKDVRVMSVGQVCASGEDVGVARFRANQTLFNQLAPRVPWFLRGAYPTGLYFSAPQAKAQASRWVLILVGVYLAIALGVAAVAWLAGRLTCARAAWSMNAAFLLVAILLAAALAYGYKNHYSTFRSVGLLSVLIGAFAGVWAAWWQARRRTRKTPTTSN